MLKPRHAAGRRGWRSHSAHTAAIALWPYFMVIRAYRQWNIRHRPEYGSLVKRTGIRRACRQPSSIFYGSTGSAGDNLVKRRKDESCTAGTPGPARLEPPVNPGVCQHPLHCWHLRQLPPPLCGTSSAAFIFSSLTRLSPAEPTPARRRWNSVVGKRVGF